MIKVATVSTGAIATVHRNPGRSDTTTADVNALIGGVGDSAKSRGRITPAW